MVQIVDARNPLLFYCQDLENYVQELDKNKLNLLLVNKSDFLTERQRLMWLKHFEARNTRVVFWSAALAAAEVNNSELNSELDELTEDDKSDFDENNNNSNDRISEAEENDKEIDEEDGLDSSFVNKFNVLATEDDQAAKSSSESEKESEESEETVSDKEEEQETEIEAEDQKEDAEAEAEPPKEPKQSTKAAENEATKQALAKLELEIKKESKPYTITEEERKRCRILKRDELIDLFRTMHKHIVDKARPGCTTIGMVGYPNVGKSSTINALFHNKKVRILVNLLSFHII